MINCVSKNANDSNGNNSVCNKSNANESNGNDSKDAISRVSTGGVIKNNNSMLYHNLSCIIRWYKGRTTFEIHKSNVKFVLQTRFYDHIIRDFDSYLMIKEYIQNNPAKWQKLGYYYE